VQAIEKLHCDWHQQTQTTFGRLEKKKKKGREGKETREAPARARLAYDEKKEMGRGGEGGREAIFLLALQPPIFRPQTSQKEKGGRKGSPDAN